MSRYVDHSDDDSPEAVLAYGRWQNNARRALKGQRGRQALRDLRAALLALPERRLIEGALCTVGGPARVRDVTAEAVAERIAAREAWASEHGYEYTDQDRELAGRWMRDEAVLERAQIADIIDGQGEGVCAVGAYLWHKAVQAGADPAEAFAGLPSVSEDGDDGLGWTAEIGQGAGLTYTLAWELAFRNDEKLRSITPEERYTAFLAWIDAELAESAAA